ncbi:hypothetical protein NGRA_1702 [Nosema granulosis]|uniref:Transcription initiation factor TFIID subunit 12 domain-containing protein n=1 Tax=Nosema granulosis TaxID=83296 RepID=A0A9P6H0Q8_9MICR|nr:hypothetical protein NGRA_1702 [Nosema granulosis]
MSIEERAANLRDKFNYLVKQYKKTERKKNAGKETVLENEDVKNELALFFKEYGKFIKARKNSFGTFDYEGYIVYLRKIEMSGYRRDIYGMNINNNMSINNNNMNINNNMSINNNNMNINNNNMNNNIQDFHTLNLSNHNINNFTNPSNFSEDKTYSELYRQECNFPKDRSYLENNRAGRDVNNSEGYSFSFSNVVNTPYNKDLYKTFDSVSHKKTPAPINRNNPTEKSPTNLYQENIYKNPAAYNSRDDYLRSNRMEYNRQNTVNSGRSTFHSNPANKQYHTDFISGYYKPEHHSPQSASLSPSINSKQSIGGLQRRSNRPSPNSIPNSSGFYEKYVNKKLTVYDFIKDSEKKTKFNDENPFSEDKTLYRKNPILNSNIPNSNILNSNIPNSNILNSNILNSNILNTSSVLPQVNNIYSNPTAPQKAFSPNMYQNMPFNRQPMQFNRLNEPLGFNHFSPEFIRPNNYHPNSNGPLWKNQFVNMDTFVHQKTTAPPFNLVTQPPLRTNTYKTIKPHIHAKMKEKITKPTTVCPEPKRKKETVQVFAKRDLKSSPVAFSSSNSEDYQRYFLDDLLKETGKSMPIPHETASFLYEFCDNFFEHIIVMSCALASNDKRKKLEFEDIKLMLKTEFDLEMPEEGSIKVIDES